VRRAGGGPVDPRARSGGQWDLERMDGWDAGSGGRIRGRLVWTNQVRGDFGERKVCASVFPPTGMKENFAARLQGPGGR
jgi:hypothetical protein